MKLAQGALPAGRSVQGDCNRTALPAGRSVQGDCNRTALPAGRSVQGDCNRTALPAGRSVQGDCNRTALPAGRSVQQDSNRTARRALRPSTTNVSPLRHTDEQTPPVHGIARSDDASDLLHVQAVLAAGAAVASAPLAARIRDYLADMRVRCADPGTPKRMPHDILLVDDDPSMIQMLGRALSGTGQLRFATSGPAALRQVREFPPDLVLLDAQMPGMDGYQVCMEMKADPLLASIPIIFVTGEGGQEFELRGLELGAADFIAKPFSPLLLRARVETQLRVKRLTDELRNIATTDALTGLANRRIFDTTLDQECQRMARTGDALSLLMIDVDHFKLFNDREGHPAGDECLREVARVLNGAAQRAGDLVARIGGEEFAILLPVTPLQGAAHAARRVLDAIHQADIPHVASPTSDRLSVSIGVGCIADGDTVEVVAAFKSRASADAPRPATADLLRRADEALYAAKRGGRAQIWSLGPEASGVPQRIDPVQQRVTEARELAQERA